MNLYFQNKARKQDSDSDNSGDEEMREIDLNKFMTVDSVGEIDEEMDADVEALLNDAQANEDSEEENEDKERTPVGGEFVKEIAAFYCEVCDVYFPGDKTPLEVYAKKHCLQRSHLKAFLRHKEEEKMVKKRKEAKERNKSESEKKEDKEETAKKPEAEVEEAKKEKPANKEETENEGGDVEDPEQADEKLWEDVDKDLGDLLRHVDPEERDEDEENDSVLNIDIER